MALIGEESADQNQSSNTSANSEHHENTDRPQNQSSNQLCEELSLPTNKYNEDFKDTVVSVDQNTASLAADVSSIVSNMDTENTVETVVCNENPNKKDPNTADSVTIDKSTDIVESSGTFSENNGTNNTASHLSSDASENPGKVNNLLISKSNMTSPSTSYCISDGTPAIQNKEVVPNSRTKNDVVLEPSMECEGSTSQQSTLPAPDVLGKSNTSSSSEVLLTPSTSSKTTASCSPSQALSSIVDYGDSSDSEDDNADFKPDTTTLVPPLPEDTLEMRMDTTGDEDIVVIGPSPKAAAEPPIIDLFSADYRETINIESGTDDSESDSDSSPSSVSTLSDSDNENWAAKVIKKEPKEIKDKTQKEAPSKKKKDSLLTKGEMSLDDLPPIEDLKISVPETLAHVIGYIVNIIAQQVVVQAHRGVPPIDLDSVLFLDNGKRTLGKIFDVFGPVQEPLYVVRFNSADHVKEHKITKGDPVFYAPSTEHTSFVVLEELMRIKGSDASGLTGNEILPSEMTDYSDDEEEARAKGCSRQNKYESSTSEFQSRKKRSRSQGQGNEVRGRGRAMARGAAHIRGPFGNQMRGPARNPFSNKTRGQGMTHNAFSNSGMRSRPPNPYEPGSNFNVRGMRPRSGTSGEMRNTFKTENDNYSSRSFSPYINEGDSSSRTNRWSQSSRSQFGGPPQFSTQMPPPTPPPSQSFPLYSPGIQGPPPGPHRAPPPNPPQSYGNMRPEEPSWTSNSTRVFPSMYPTTSLQNTGIPQTPPPFSPAYSPCPMIYPNVLQGRDPTAHNNQLPSTSGMRNGSWSCPSQAPPGPPPFTHPHPPPNFPSDPPPSVYSQPPPAHLQTHPPPLHLQKPPPAELFHTPPPPPPSPGCIYPSVNSSVPPPRSSPYSNIDKYW